MTIQKLHYTSQELEHEGVRPPQQELTALDRRIIDLRYRLLRWGACMLSPEEMDYLLLGPDAYTNPRKNGGALTMEKVTAHAHPLFRIKTRNPLEYIGRDGRRYLTVEGLAAERYLFEQSFARTDY